MAAVNNKTGPAWWKKKEFGKGPFSTLKNVRNISSAKHKYRAIYGNGNK